MADATRTIRNKLIAEGHDAFLAQLAAGHIARGIDKDTALRVAENSLDS